MFSCEYCEIFKNTYFVEHLRVAASASFLLELRYEIMGRNELRRILYDHIVANMEGASVDLSVGVGESWRNPKT